MATSWPCAEEKCGALNHAKATACEVCGTARVEAPAAQGAPAPLEPAGVVAGPICAQCRDAFTLWTALTICDDGQRRCAGCKVAYLKTIADAEAQSAATQQAVRAEMDEFRKIAGSAAWQARFHSKR